MVDYHASLKRFWAGNIDHGSRDKDRGPRVAFFMLKRFVTYRDFKIKINVFLIQIGVTGVYYVTLKIVSI